MAHAIGRKPRAGRSEDASVTNQGTKKTVDAARIPEKTYMTVP